MNKANTEELSDLAALVKYAMDNGAICYVVTSINISLADLPGSHIISRPTSIM